MPRSARRPSRALGPVLLALAVLGAACGGGANPDVVAENPTTVSLNSNTDQSAPPTSPPPEQVQTVAGMPPVVDPSNIYSEAAAGKLSAATNGAKFLVYVPNEASGTVTVIDPTTKSVLTTFSSGFIPQHVVPSYDMTQLYVLNNNGNTITPIDPLTGKAEKAIAVDNPYNLYFTPDGTEAIVVAEGEQRFDFTDPKTFAVHSSLQTDCNGLNHIDYAIDGSYFIATCEFDGRIIKVDTATRKVVGTMKLDISASGRTDTIKKIAQPQDVRVSNDGKVFYIADLITSGVFLIDGPSFTQTGFIKAGVGTHGLYPSRDGQRLYIVNRGTETIPPVGSFKGKGKGSISVLDFATQKIVAEWPMPGGGTPDMGNLTPDGKELWLGGRYDAEVYVFDTEKGELIKRIPAGQNPHGLTVWPQPGRYSFGHTGNVR